MKKQVDSQRIERIVEIVNKINKENNQGDILEFGIFEGFSLCEITKEVRKNNMKNRIFGFDSFKGLPNSSSENDYSMWRYQDYCSFKENTEKEMIEYIGNIDDITLIEGYYSDTLTPELKNKYNFKEASMIHVDCDMYSSALCSLNWCRDLIKSGTYLILDEWDGGEDKAFFEFIKKNKIKCEGYKIVNHQKIFKIK